MILSLSTSLNRLKPKQTPDDCSSTIKYNSDPIPRSWDAMVQKLDEPVLTVESCPGIGCNIITDTWWIEVAPSVGRFKPRFWTHSLFGGDEPVK